MIAHACIKIYPLLIKKPACSAHVLRLPYLIRRAKLSCITYISVLFRVPVRGICDLYAYETSVGASALKTKEDFFFFLSASSLVVVVVVISRSAITTSGICAPQSFSIPPLHPAHVVELTRTSRAWQLREVIIADTNSVKFANGAGESRRRRRR